MTLGLFVLSMLPLFSVTVFLHFILRLLLACLGLFVQVVLVDFSAQVLGYSAQTIKCFYAFSLSLLPFLLFLPLTSIQFSFPVLSSLFSLIIVFWSLSLTFVSIQVLYGVGKWRSLLIYGLPFIVLVSIILLLFIVAGVTLPLRSI